MGPSETPPLCGFETYDQIVRCLASKAYKGVHTRCPAWTSASFGAEETTEIVENPESEKDILPPALHNDAGCETGIQGLVLHLQRKAGHCGEEPIVRLIPCGESQHPWNEMDEGASTLLLGYPIEILAVAETPYRRERGTYPCQLAHRLLSVWHWSLVVEPPTYPPMPTSMDIGYWLHQTRKNNNRQFWIEAHTCALQRVAEASVGRRWIAFEGRRVPKIARVVEVFLHATGTRVPLERIRQCWPAWRTETPMQNLEGIRWDIVRKLD